MNDGSNPEFVQEYAYIEDYSLRYKPQPKDDDLKDERGVIVIDLFADE